MLQSLVDAEKMDARTQPVQRFITAPEQALTINSSTTGAPTSTLDPYADQNLLNPWPLYRELREMGPAVWLEKYRMFALTRYDAVVKVLRATDSGCAEIAAGRGGTRGRSARRPAMRQGAVLRDC